MPSVVPFNPLLTYKFQLYFVDQGDAPLLGMTKMSALKQKTQNVTFRTGGHIWNSASQIPGGVEYEAVTFEQGLGLDDGRLEDWAMAANGWKDGQAGHQPKAFRHNLRVDVMNTQGEIRLSHILHDCWVSEYQALPELDANNLNTVGISIFTVQMEGWSRAT